MAVKEPKIISIASGKGGVGKTLSSIHLAISASRMGVKTLIFDGDLGLANIDVVLGLRPRYTLVDLFEDGVGLEDIILDGPADLSIIPSGSGFSNIANLSLTQRISLLDHLVPLMSRYDLVVIDTGAGISDSVLHLNSIAHQCVVVATPEPTAMTDAYAFVKVMSQKYPDSSLSLLVNQVVHQQQGLKVSNQITEVARRHLNIKVDYLGSVPKDKTISRLVMLKGSGFEDSIQTVAGQAWNEIAWKILSDFENRNADDSGVNWLNFVFPENKVQVERL